jgi:predicted DNA-binding antitoxin AbrB/MazE fold protein
VSIRALGDFCYTKSNNILEAMMVKTLDAVYDGTGLRPMEPLTLEPNTRVRITIETEPTSESTRSFLKTARTLNLDGPPDWSANLDDYLYGGAQQRDE